MIARIWRTGLDESRADEYTAFATERSLPMFRRQPGFRGLVFARAAEGRVVITFWDDAESVARLDASSDYRETVAAIGAAGFLREPQSVEVFEVDEALFPDRVH
ncbi:heme-degrading monooxygenase HmoA [Diaminobutyricimonas aerilata]|uniref:Heme-degrading monooxygenase HmoA n=1 Tax=Diaminobutyricimonas aerilata TaxID=1162967 RepID=A0A2M9CHL5_9MICO|nr:hypothetical protein [Diaminobutyricimonas aerilata]PJJ71377.1 heme-degrading monooxygenase HmoA [Diaminobutyricimonas aerilata]